MADTTAAPPDVVGSSTNFTGGGTASNWLIDGTHDILCVVSTQASAVLRDFDVVIPDASGVRPEVIDDVTVRVMSTTTGQHDFNQIGVQLEVAGALIGVEKTSTEYGGAGTTGFDASFSGWATLPTEAQLESTGFGVQVRIDDDAGMAVQIDGVSVVVSYHQVYEPEERIYTRLTGYTALTNLTTQIHFGDRPQGEKLPAVTFDRISGVPWRAMGQDANLVQSRFQINSYADDPLEAKKVAEQVKNAMNRWSSSSDYVTIESCFVDNEYNQEVEIGAADKGAYWVGLDVLVNHRTS